MEEMHRERVRQLWHARFGGEDEFTEGWINDALDDDRPEMCYVAADGGNVVGFGLATVCYPDYAEDYIGLDVPEFDPWDPTGILHMSAVEKSRTGEGIGTDLMDSRLQYLQIQDCGGVMGIAWHRDDAPDSRALFEKFGFDQLATFKNYYSRTHGRPNCPACTGECECTASVYAREL
ncbi:GNAT family N-acetyltransferase [Halostella sp. JP-L12]|uniref:GNAT family N-acetyltransferase n=1 Tax=Halostella TaxID=1843185 RepID=UPI0013CEBA50|nr:MULTISPECIES: GNAT family N-acetyltransferase [Halostella]NHN50009.1 GNAT family N-acetyltransferase [Halostella sp. JP-L12]